MPIVIALWIAILCLTAPTCRAGDLNKELSVPSVAKHFKNFEGTFVLVDKETGKKFVYNQKLADERDSPCSTFKILNSLVGLETGVVKNERHLMKWDGTKYEIDSWNHDQTLQSALTNSCVWYYQSLARDVGEDRMKDLIGKVAYGNQDISGDITKFWISGKLRVSPNEQVGLLSRLIDDDLPFSTRNTAIVRGMMRLDQTSKGILYGKTGTSSRVGKNSLGWFVGYVAKPGRTLIFATRIKGNDAAYGREARKITEGILKEAALL